MEDRLLEFQRMAGVSSNASISLSTEGDSSRDFLPQFSARTKLLQQALNQIKYNNQEILRLKDKHREATLNDQEKKISGDINKLIDQNNVLSMTIKDQLSLMKEDIEESKANDPNEPETRMKVVSHQSLSNKFSDVLKESQSVQLDYKGGVKDKLARQAKIYDNTLSPEELEEIVNDPEGMEKLVSSKMIGGAHNRIQNAVSDIQDKYRDILKLEKSVEIMHQMFVDMAMLVHASGEALNSIEVNVNDTKHYVKKAVVELHKGKTMSQKAKKWQCCMLIVGLVIIVILLWPVLHVIG